MVFNSRGIDKMRFRSRYIFENYTWELGTLHDCCHNELFRNSSGDFQLLYSLGIEQHHIPSWKILHFACKPQLNSLFSLILLLPALFPFSLPLPSLHFSLQLLPLASFNA
ncbi:hypothetical protein SLE2022_375940 [Rubroshorea leprosula]